MSNRSKNGSLDASNDKVKVLTRYFYAKKVGLSIAQVFRKNCAKVCSGFAIWSMGGKLSDISKTIRGVYKKTPTLKRFGY